MDFIVNLVGAVTIKMSSASMERRDRLLTGPQTENLWTLYVYNKNNELYLVNKERRLYSDFNRFGLNSKEQFYRD
jgi:hypothetical protein